MVGYVEVKTVWGIVRIEMGSDGRFSCPSDSEWADVAESATRELSPRPSRPGNPEARLRAFAERIGAKVQMVAEGPAKPASEPGRIY